MSLKLMEFPNKDEKKAILETHSQGMESFNNFVNHLSYQPYNLNPDLTNTTVATYKKLSNLHNRTGRARFRRAPVPPPQLPPTSILPTYTPPPTSIPSTSTLPPALQIQNPQKSQNQSLTLDFTKPNLFRSNPKSLDLEFPKETFSVSSNSSFMSSAITGDLTGDNSVSNGKLGTSSLFLNPAVSGGKPPLSSASLKKSCHDHSGDVSGQGSGSNKCHCKKRKNRMKRIEKVPAISSKIADIPADQYSWRKYGQKPIKGSPFPRGYYRCSTSKQCPARKKVERSTEDPTMLIVTYEEEHRHHEIHGHSHTAMQGNISGNMGLFGGV